MGIVPAERIVFRATRPAADPPAHHPHRRRPAIRGRYAPAPIRQERTAGGKPRQLLSTHQLNEAWTWEHQALVRARPVTGNPR